MNETWEKTEILQLTAVQKAVELGRPWVLFLYVAAAAGWRLVAVPLAVAVELAGFVQMHDAIHRAYALSKGGNDFLLSMIGPLAL